MRHRTVIRYLAWTAVAVAVVVGCQSVGTDSEPLNIVAFNNWQDVPEYVPADGTSEVDLMVTAITTAGLKVQNIAIDFTATQGQLSQARVVTDANGIARTSLIAVSSTTDVTSLVDATVADTTGYILNPRTNSMVSLNKAPEGTIALVSTGPMTDEELDARVHALMVERARESARERQRGLQGLLGDPVSGAAASQESAQADQLTVVMEGVLITVTTDTNPLTADGSSSAKIEARVRTTSGKSLTNRQVDFTADFGKITPAATTNQFGIASATLTSVLTTAAADTVLVELNSILTKTLVQPYVQPLLTLTADDTSVPANGTSSTTVRARLLSPTGTPVVGARVVFSATGLTDASLTPVNAGLTNNSGEASAILKSGVTSGTLAVTATFSSLVSNLNVSVADLNLSATATPSTMVANGTNTSLIQVLVTEATTNRGVQGAQVNFATTLGTITPTSSTNASGVATAILTASTTSGTATVTATQGPRTDTVDVVMLPRDLQITLSSTKADGIIRDSKDTSTLTILVQDPDGKTLNGIPVSWSTTAGTVFPTSGTTANGGTHQATLTADSGTTDTVATVTVDIGDSTRTAAIPLKGITITSSADVDTILANGAEEAVLTWQLQETTSGAGVANHSISISKVSGPSVTSSSFPTTTSASGTATVTVKGTSGGTLLMQAAVAGITQQQGVVLLSDQYTVAISADVGSLIRDGEDDATITVEVVDRFFNPVVDEPVTISLTGNGTLTRPDRTGSNGKTTATLTADVSSTTGNAQLIATAGGVSDTLDVPLYGVNISVVASPTTLVADGDEQTKVTATVRAATTGVLLPGKLVYFSFTPSDSVLFTSGSAPTAANGQASVFISSTAVTTINGTITARIGNDPTSTLTSTTNVTIVPQVLSLAFSSTSDNLRVLRNQEDTITLSVEVTDALVGKAIADADVTWSKTAATPSGVTLSRTTSKTNSSGIAEIDVKADANSADATAGIIATIGANVDTADVSLVGLTLTATAVPTTITANGVDESTITATLKETTTGNTVPNKEIGFATTLGRIPATATTSTLGVAAVALTADTTSGTATVTVSNGSITTTKNVTFKTPTASSVSLSASATELQVKGTGGTETAMITATVLDGDNQAVPAGQLVKFTLSPGGSGTFTGGAVTDTVETDADGQAAIAFQAGTTATDVTITAAVLGTSVTASTPLITVVAGPTQNVTVSATTISFEANGLYERQLTAVLSDTYGNAIAEKPVVWTATPDTVGSIVGNSTTDENGVVHSTFTYGRGNEPAAVSYTATSQGVSGSLTIPIGSLTLARSASSILRDQVDSATLTATLRDGAGTAVELSGIGFAVTAGTGSVTSAGSVTDINGEAATTFVGDANSADGSGTVTATYRTLTDNVSITLRGVTLTAAASPDTISANGAATTTVTANLKETTANRALESRSVTFASDLGTIAGSGTTDGSGNAAVTYTATSSAGTATVDVTWGGLATTATIVQSAATASAILLEASEVDLQVLGTGGLEQSVITATVYDQEGNTVPAGQSVTLTVSPDGTFSNGAATSTKLTNGAGQATFTYTSGATAGTKVFSATSGAASGSAALVNVGSGPAATVLIGYDIGSVTTAGGVSTLTITGIIADAQGNSVAEATPVFFELTAGANFAAITPSSVTDDTGVATATLTYPSSNSGSSITIQVTCGGVSNTVTFNLP